MKKWLVIILLILIFALLVGSFWMLIRSTTYTPLPTATSEIPTPTPLQLSLKELIQNRDRVGIKNWSRPQTISTLNQEVANLTQTEKSQLADTVLFIDGDATAAEKSLTRKLLLQTIEEIFSKKDLGFYAEILSYTDINIEGDGYFGSCNKVQLSPQINTVSSGLRRDFFMHETFHSFNCVNGGPGEGHANPLDEGSAIWVFKKSFPENRTSIELSGGWAETTFGTQNYYRDIGVPGYPKNLPLLAVSNPNSKLRAVYEWLSEGDHSSLPWNSQSKLTYCYQQYYQSLNRDIDFDDWLAKAALQSKKMAADEKCAVKN